jgi:hypothetical protein
MLKEEFFQSLEKQKTRAGKFPARFTGKTIRKG